MMDNALTFLSCAGWIPWLLMGLLGLLLGWLFFRGKPVAGDLNVEGEARLRKEADELRAKLRAVEGNVATRDGEISDLKGKLAAAAAGAGAAAVAAKAVDKGGDDEEAYALEWRNRYLAARVKYLEGRLAEDAPKPKAKAKPKAKPKAKKAAAPKRKVAAKKPRAKAAPKPKVLYTDGPTDGKPDDLKLIKGIGPKFEKDLNNKGIYYFRQIANWKKADVTMVEGVIDSIPGRIGRDEWVRQAKGLAKSSAKPAAAKSKTRKKPGPKPGTKRGAKNLDGSPRKKPGPKPKAKAPVDPMDKYFDNVKKYDSRAKRNVVSSIVKYCGIALRTRDGSLVACSDKKEREQIVNGFAAKKLGLKADAATKLVEDVCQEMKAQRQKSRVTFYYLMAKKARKLSVFGS